MQLRLLVWSLLAAGVPALAQYNPVAIYVRMPALYSSTMANMAPVWRQQNVVAAYKLATGGGTARPAAVAPAADFTFRYQGRSVAVDEMAALLAEAPNERREVARQMGELIRTVADDLKQGGTEYDVSKAMMFYTATMFAIARPESELDQAGMERLLRQFRTELMDGASMKASPADRTQRQWETMLGIGGLMLMGYTQASQQGNQAAIQGFRATAEKGISELFKVDARQLRLDPRAERPLTMTGAAVATAAPPAPLPPVVAERRVTAPAAAPAPAPAAAGVIRLGHYHTINGVHPAELRMGPDGLSFDPLGNTCSQAAVTVAYADVETREPAVNGTGEVLLNVKLRDPRNPKKTLNFNFATEDSVNAQADGMVVVKSPAGAIDRLRQVRETLRGRGAR